MKMENQKQDRRNSDKNQPKHHHHHHHHHQSQLEEDSVVPDAILGGSVRGEEFPKQKQPLPK